MWKHMARGFIKKKKPKKWPHVLLVSVGHEYIGCYIDTGDRAIPDFRFDSDTLLTPASCGSHCQQHGSRYIGLQNGRTCFCGSDGIAYDRHGKVSDSQCNMACTGDPLEICGAGWRNSVFDLWGKFI